MKVSPDGLEPDITVFCYGGMLEDVEEAIQIAFEEAEILCEVICPTKLFPASIGPLLESVRRTEKLLTVEEGPLFAALGSELIALLAQHSIRLSKVGRIGNNTIIPCSLKAELNLLPSCEAIARKIRDLCDE